MAITFGGNLGQAQSKTAGQTTVITCGSTAPVGAFVWVSYTVDSETATTPTVTVTDSEGNTYVTDDAMQGGSATARTGIRSGIAYSKITTALTSGSDTITLTTSVTNVVARVVVAQWFDGVSSTQGDTRTTAAGSLGTTTLTTPNAATGEIILCGVGYEETAAPTYDSDTTNGSWSTGYGLGTTGSGAQSNVYAAIQYKIVTAGGTQTWNLTHPNTDRIAYAFCFEEDSGPAAITGTLASTEAADTLAASGTYTPPAITGTVAVTEAADTLAASGTYTPPAITGTLSVTEAADTLSASGTVAGAGAITGTLAVTEAADTLAASGTVTAPARTGTLAVTEAADTLAASGTITPPAITGSLAVTEAADTLAASGVVAGPGAITGTLAVTEAADTVSASGTFTAPARTGTLAVTEAADTLAASGTVAGPGGITGSLSVTEAADTLVASGAFTAPAITGTLSVTEAFDTLIAFAFGPAGDVTFEPLRARSVAYITAETDAYLSHQTTAFVR